MELQNTTSRLFSLLVLMFFLGGCETHLNSEPLEIIGTPPNEMYYDSVFSYQFGAKGGDGLYKYKYVQNPEGSSGNTVVLEPDPINETKPGFWLMGIPTIATDDEFLSISERELVYALDVTDGASIVRREYNFTLKKNALVLNSPQAAIKERQVINAPARQIARAWQNGATNVCRQGYARDYDTAVVNGQQVYPLVVGVRLKAPSSRRVEISYRFVSGYDEDLGELAVVNKERARPNVDYLDEVRTMIFEPGETQCIFYLNVLDDNQVEGVERLEVQFFDRKGAMVDITGATGQILITENEPIPKHEPVKTTANEGETVTTEFSIPAPYGSPIDILVSVDTHATTANDDDFELRPQSGRVTIPAGETKASYSVVLKNNDDEGETEDDVVSIKTSLDELNRVDPLQVAINKWRFGSEVVARESDGSQVIDFAYGDGKFFVLTKITSMIGEDGFALVVVNLDGVVNQNVPGVSQLGLNITPVAVVFDSESGKAIVAANVDGRVSGESYYGGRDFAVFAFDMNLQGAYQLVDSVQYGSSEDDILQGMHVREIDELFLFGSTTGSAFENVPGTDMNAGGADGFVYKLRKDDLSKMWSKFVGTANDDAVAALDISREDLLVMVSTQNTDTDAFLKILSLSTGETKAFNSDSVVNVPKTQLDIASPRNDLGKGVALMGSGVNFSAIVNSDADLPTFSMTPSGSQDGFLMFFDTESGNSAGVAKMATPLDDRVVALEILDQEGAMAVGGVTDGEFEGQVRKGSDNQDAFVASAAAEKIGVTAISRITQFGTLSDDDVINVRRVNDHKFMVLWSETSSSGDGSKVYRLSPFSVDGKKLTPDP